jgi:hypothetical protein
MKNIWKILLIVLVFVAFIILIYFLSRPKPMNKFTFPDTVVVNNYTEFEIDTIVKVFVNKILEQDSVTINIFYIHNQMNYDKLEIMGYLEPIPYNNREYLLFINKNIYQMNTILSHEFVHFDQYIKNELVLNRDLQIAIYKNDTIDLHKVPYESRLFEQDAYNRQNQFLKQLNQLLYK